MGRSARGLALRKSELTAGGKIRQIKKKILVNFRERHCQKVEATSGRGPIRRGIVTCAEGSGKKKKKNVSPTKKTEVLDVNEDAPL